MDGQSGLPLMCTQTKSPTMCWQGFSFSSTFMSTDDKASSCREGVGKAHEGVCAIRHDGAGYVSEAQHSCKVGDQDKEWAKNCNLKVTDMQKWKQFSLLPTTLSLYSYSLYLPFLLSHKVVQSNGCYSP